MAESRPGRARLWFGLAVAGAILALPVVAFTTCQVRGPYVPPPEEKWPIGPSIFHAEHSLLIGLALGVPVLIGFVVLAIVISRREKRGQPQGDPP